MSELRMRTELNQNKEIVQFSSRQTNLTGPLEHCLTERERERERVAAKQIKLFILLRALSSLRPRLRQRVGHLIRHVIIVLQGECYGSQYKLTGTLLSTLGRRTAYNTLMKPPPLNIRLLQLVASFLLLL